MAGLEERKEIPRSRGHGRGVDVEKELEPCCHCNAGRRTYCRAKGGSRLAGILGVRAAGLEGASGSHCRQRTCIHQHWL